MPYDDQEITIRTSYALRELIIPGIDHVKLPIPSFKLGMFLNRRFWLVLEGHKIPGVNITLREPLIQLILLQKAKQEMVRSEEDELDGRGSFGQPWWPRPSVQGGPHAGVPWLTSELWSRRFFLIWCYRECIDQILRPRTFQWSFIFFCTSQLCCIWRNCMNKFALSSNALYRWTCTFCSYRIS